MAPVPNKPTVSVDVKQHSTNSTVRPQDRDLRWALMPRSPSLSSQAVDPTTVWYCTGWENWRWFESDSSIQLNVICVVWFQLTPLIVSERRPLRILNIFFRRTGCNHRNLTCMATDYDHHNLPSVATDYDHHNMPCMAADHDHHNMPCMNGYIHTRITMIWPAWLQTDRHDLKCMATACDHHNLTCMATACDHHNLTCMATDYDDGYDQHHYYAHNCL